MSRSTHGFEVASLVLVLFALGGCGAGDGPPVADAARPDGPRRDRSADRPREVGRPDARRPDSRRPDLTAAADLRARPDLRPDSAPACAYVDVDDRLVQCGSAYRMVRYFATVPAVSGCPAFWGMSLSGPRFTSPESAATAAGCSTTCMWRASTSVTFLHCGARNGYIVFQAPGCADLYQFASGYYPSVAAWTATHPCRDAGTAG